MSKLKRVQFRVGYHAYNSGEEAGFPDAEADKLIASGRAVLVTKGEAPAAPTPPPDEPTKGEALTDDAVNDSKGGKPRHKR